MRLATASAYAFRWPTAFVSCNADEKLSGGGGSCASDGGGYIYLTVSAPSGNGWVAGCDCNQFWNAHAYVYAICVK